MKPLPLILIGSLDNIHDEGCVGRPANWRWGAIDLDPVTFGEGAEVGRPTDEGCVDRPSDWRRGAEVSQTTDLGCVDCRLAATWVSTKSFSKVCNWLLNQGCLATSLCASHRAAPLYSAQSLSNIRRTSSWGYIADRPAPLRKSYLLGPCWLVGSVTFGV